MPRFGLSLEGKFYGMGLFEGAASATNSFKDFVRAQLLTPVAPAQLSSRYRQIGAEALGEIETALRENFFHREPAGYLQSELGRQDMHAHLTGRIEMDRTWCAPWLNAAQPLDGAKILEIGCGTGATTVVLAEQGARVTAIDVDAPALKVAKRRLDLYGLEAELHVGNAVEIESVFAGRQFDFIIYWASLEHMTHAERIATLQQSWRMLPKGAQWVVIETPNRLHYYDSHTAFLPFFLWLPDEVAVEYAKFSSREGYRTAMDGKSLDNVSDRELLARWGRGMSYHEFELVMGPVADIKVVNSMLGYHAQQNKAYGACRSLSPDASWARVLRRAKPDAHAAFFEAYLNLIIEKT